MKRDLDKIKCILLKTEAIGALETTEIFWEENNEAPFYHAMMLLEEGYLVGDYANSGRCVQIKRMTMKGHDLLERLRNNNIPDTL